jgi:tRNA-dihydrouridine synthase 3
MMNRPAKLLDVVAAMGANLERSITVKIRTGWDEKNPSAHKLLPQLQKLSCSRKIGAVMIHGRSRLQRYSKLADWDYVLAAAQSQDPTLPLLPVIGNGDIMSWDDWKEHQFLVDNFQSSDPDTESIKLVNCPMVGRGALIKPWLPSELKEQRHIDISATERLDIVRYTSLPRLSSVLLAGTAHPQHGSTDPSLSSSGSMWTTD